MEQLYITKLQGYNFKNFTSFEVKFVPGINVLCGRNAVGKTNTIEAIQLLTSGVSFKRSTYDQLVQLGCTQGSIEVNISSNTRNNNIKLDLIDNKKIFTKNNKRILSNEVSELLPSILFYPDDLYVIKGSSKQRRQLIDMLGIQTHRQYRLVKHDFEKVLIQRNNLLKQSYIDHQLLDVWTEYLVTTGVRLTLYRIKLIKRLIPYLKKHYEALASHESIDVAYTSSTDVVLPSLHEYSFDNETMIQQLTDSFTSKLKNLKAEEFRLQRSLIGPQLDDISFKINGNDARYFGSQGQQRSLILSWKMAEVDLIHEYLGIYPLLLLDDVMSELDQVRRDHIITCINRGIQCIITTTHLDYFNSESLQGMEVIHIG